MKLWEDMDPVLEENSSEEFGQESFENFDVSAGGESEESLESSSLADEVYLPYSDPNTYSFILIILLIGITACYVIHRSFARLNTIG